MSEPPAEINSSKPHAARVYDFFLGGTNNFAADREAAEEVLRNSPSVRTTARENRAFLGRAVRYLATQGGIRQFLDIGAGLPATASVHSVAQTIAPSAHVVYADNDPLVLAHAQALLTSAPEGRTAYIDADLRDPAAILSNPVTRDVLDFGQPIALIMVAILHFVQDAEKPDRVATAAGQRAMQQAGIAMRKRDSDEFARLAFQGLELVPPGVVLVSEWRPDVAGPRPTPAEVNCYGGVARKP